MGKRYWGLPYMGSKSRFIHKLYSVIAPLAARENVARHLIDPFAGGMAVSQYFASRGWKTSPSDLSPEVMALANYLTSGNEVSGLLGEFITHEEFDALVRQSVSSRKASGPRPERGLVHRGASLIAYSFGTSMSRYAYNPQIETVKSAAHNLIVYGHSSLLLQRLGMGLSLQSQIASLPSVSARRKTFTRLGKALGWDQNTYVVQHLARFDQMRIFRDLSRAINDKSLGRGRGTALGRGITQDYREVLTNLLEQETASRKVVYLDPPYNETNAYLSHAKLSANGRPSTKGDSSIFSIGEMWALAEKIARRGHLVCVSSYGAPHEWSSIYNFPTFSTFNSSPKLESGSGSNPTERLFVWAGDRDGSILQ